MQPLEKIISRYMRRVTCYLVAIILAIIVYIQITNEHRHAYESATRTFYQIEQVLKQNQEELKEIQKKYAGNPETMNQKMQELYSEHKINPAMGCLPL